MNIKNKNDTNARIGEFILEIGDMQNVSGIFDSLTKRLYELTSFNKMVYLMLSPDVAELKVLFSHGYSHEEMPQFFFDIFEDPDQNILSAIFEKKTAVVKNGISAINDLSIRLDLDNYVMIPMVLRSEGEENTETPLIKEKEVLKSMKFLLAGVFVFGCGDEQDESKIKYEISLAEKFIRLTGMIIKDILILENFRLTAEKNKKELEAARTIQEKLLPEKLPQNDILQAFAFYIPVEEVSGDYYDLFMLSEGVYAVFIADVSGHGVSAALIMSAAKILLKTIASANLPPAQTLRKVNEELVNHIPANRFMTAFYAIIDTNSRKMTYTCAGHCPILLFNKQSKEYLQFQSDGFSLGMFPELDLPNHEYYYKKNENRLVLYTDGIVDCFNKEKTQFSLIRLKSIIAKTLEMSGDKVVSEVMESVRNFMGTRSSEDDLTLLVVDF